MRVMMLCVGAFATSAEAIELSCTNFNAPADEAWCHHLPGQGSILDKQFDSPGVFAATLTFDEPLTDTVGVSGHRLHREGTLDATGGLILAPTGGEMFMAPFAIAPGQRQVAFEYRTSPYTFSSFDGKLSGSNSGFRLTGPLPKFSLSVSRAPAIPEPAAWTMMISGLGILGAAMRRRRQGQLGIVSRRLG